MVIQTTAEITQVIERDQEEIISKMLKDLITDHRQGVGRETLDLWKRYTLKDVPIYHRKAANYEKVDRRTANDFYADIVDTKTGYMGNEVTVGLNKESYKSGEELKESALERDRQFLRQFAIENSTEDLNSEMVRNAAAVRLGYRLLYSQDNEIKIKNLMPWEVIYIYDQSINDPQIAIRYYTIKSKEFGYVDNVKELTAVEWYDDINVKYYIDDGELNFHLDTNREGGIQPHLFNGVPVIPFQNNEQLMAEPEKVTDLIDAYDAIISSTASEVEQLRLAYMYLKGAGLNIDNEFMRQVEQTGAIGLEEGGEAGFITKELAVQGVKTILDELRRNIYEFSKSIDMSKDFGGEMRVIGWQVALLNLENSCKITERKFTRALRQQYKLMTDYWSAFKNIKIDPYSLEFTFTRNFPRDLHAEAETLQLLLGSVSTKTAFEQMSFIDDPEVEIARIEEEGNVYGGMNGDEESEDERGEDDEEDESAS